MSLAAPWSARAADALTLSLDHVYRIELADAWGILPLDVDPDAHPRVKFDEGYVPHVQSSALRVRVPDQATLDRLDPRLAVRVRIFAGYRFGDGVEDVQMLADLLLVDRRVIRPGNYVELSAMSDERLAINNAPTFDDSDQDYYDFFATDLCVDVIEDMIAAAVPGASITIDPAVSRGTIGEDMQLLAGDPYWPLILDLADRIDAWVYSRGGKAFSIVPRPTIAGQSSLIATVGQNGTIVRSSTDLNLDDWANVVVIRYADKRFALAKVTTGPYSVSVVPRKVLLVERETLPAGGGRSAAEAILRRAVSRGRSITFSAVSAYWLRPGQTATVQLPTGPQNRHLVVSVDFDLAAGSMDVTTRQPENVTITTGE